MKIKKSIWKSALDLTLDNASCVSEAVDWMAKNLRDDYPEADTLELQSLTRGEFLEYVQRFDEYRDVYEEEDDDAFENYWSFDDYKHCHILFPSANQKWNDLEIPERRISSFELRSMVSAAKETEEAPRKAVEQVLAEIAWDKSFEFDGYNPKVRPSVNHKWGSKIDPLTNNHKGCWVYSP